MRELPNGRRIATVEAGTPRRGSPSEVFSSMEHGKEAQRPHDRFAKCFTIIATTSCVIFLIATICLAIIMCNEIDEKTTRRIGVAPSSSRSTDNSDNDNIRAVNWPGPSGSLNAQYKRAVVATDHGLCSEVGRDVLLEGGNAVDAAIAGLLCVGVVNPQSSGIGGGFLLTLYNASTERCMTIDARETAPAAANESMFAERPQDSLIGYKSVATPGELHGFWTAFNRYGSGKVNWTRLFQPSIRLARDGFPVSSNLAMILQRKEADIMTNEDMRRVFVDPRTSRVYEEGDKMKRERFAELLIELAGSKNPVQLFYSDGIAQTIAGEMKDNGGYITLEDLNKYRSIIHETPLESITLRGHLAMCGPPPPSSFAVMQAVVAVMAQFYGKGPVDLDDPQVYHRLIEAEKFAYAQRTRLGDVEFIKDAIDIAHNMTKPAFIRWISRMITEKAHPKEYYSPNLTAHVPDHGTSHIIVLDHEGNGVSATSTINQLLGSKRISPTLGIVWNDEMNDFSQPFSTDAFGFAFSPANYIQPKKRPMSSMSPTIVYSTNTKKIKMVVGASGGSRIISSVAQTIIRTLVFNQTVKEAVDAPRIHNQFIPHITEYETTMPKTIMEVLKQRGQNVTGVERQPSVVQALVVLDDGFIYANSDFRRKTVTYPVGY